MCGTGVTSRIETTRIPAAWMALIAASRPEPGPLTITFTVFNPCSMAARAAVSPARWAAKAVDFLEPRKPIAPALLCEMTLPCGSVRVISVLLKVALIYALPWGTNFFSRRRVRCLGIFLSLYFFLRRCDLRRGPCQILWSTGGQVFLS